jgi:hypothetical protein
MAFLYSSYIIIYAIANPLLGRYIDSVFNSTDTVRPALLNTAAVQLTVVSAIVFISTFIPKGAIALNPKLLDQEKGDSAHMNGIKNPAVIHDETMGSNQNIHKEKNGQNMQQEKKLDTITFF